MLDISPSPSNQFLQHFIQEAYQILFQIMFTEDNLFFQNRAICQDLIFAKLISMLQAMLSFSIVMAIAGTGTQ